MKKSRRKNKKASYRKKRQDHQAGDLREKMIRHYVVYSEHAKGEKMIEKGYAAEDRTMISKGLQKLMVSLL